MQNFIQPGKSVTITAPSNIVSGAFVQVGEIIGIAAGDAASGQPLDLVTEGVFSLPKLSAAVLTVGEAVAWNGSAVAELSTANDSKIGVAVEAAGNGATSAKIRLSAF